MSRNLISQRSLALAALVVALVLLICGSGATLADTNPSSATDPGGSVAVSGTTYRQVAATTVASSTPRPISAYGSVQAQLTGDNQWDSAACYIALDGSQIGPLAEADLSTQTMTFEQDLTSVGGINYQSRPAQVQTRDLTPVGFAPSVAAGTHSVALMCAVSHGTDSVTFAEPTVVAFTDPAAGATIGSSVSIPGHPAQTIDQPGLVKIGAPPDSFSTNPADQFTSLNVNTTITTRTTGPLMAFATVSATLTGDDQWDTLTCNLSGSVLPTYNTGRQTGGSNQSAIDLTSQKTGYQYSGNVVAFHDAFLKRGTLGLVAHYTNTSPETYTFDVGCKVTGADNVTVTNAGIVVVAPSGQEDSGAAPADTSVQDAIHRQVASTTLQTSVPSRVLALGSAIASLSGDYEWDWAACQLQIAGQATGRARSTALTSQGVASNLTTSGLTHTHVYAYNAPINPSVSVVLPAGTYAVSMSCWVMQGTDMLNIGNLALMAFSMPVPPPPPAPLTNCGPVPATTASYHSDPIPGVGQTGAVNNRWFLTKQLNSYAAYGAFGSGVDVLYAGQAATWTFALPPSINPAAVTSVTAHVSMVADDHTTDLSSYSLKVWTNGDCRANGAAGLPHGAPYGGPFTNWVTKDYPASTGGSTYTVTIANSGGDWYAVNWIELEIWTQ